jgi:hypothetical protein
MSKLLTITNTINSNTNEGLFKKMVVVYSDSGDAD